MSGNSEPLRETSSESTNTPDGSLPLPANRPPRIGQGDGDTQRSLQQASMALEVALNRIVEVRRSLLQLSRTLPRQPSEDDPDPVEYLEFDSDDSLTSLFAAEPARNPEATAGSTPWPGWWHVPPPSTSEAPLATATSPAPMPPQPRAQPRALDGGTYRRFRPSLRFTPPIAGIVPAANVDPAATTRGLRVAAREANPNLRDSPDFVRQEYDAILGSLGLHALPPAPPLPRPDQTARLQQTREIMDANEPRPGELGLPDQRRPTFTPASPSTSWRSPDPRRWRLLPNRLPYILPNTDAPGPQGAADAQVQGGAPYFAPPSGMSTMSSDTFMERYRLYQDALRADSMGSNVNIDWSDDDFLTWLFPARAPAGPHTPPPPPPPIRRPERQTNIETIRQDMDALRQNLDTIRVTRTTETQVSPPDRSGRRRGWARLDPDGNEIPFDEELELERTRTEYRIRALQQARRQAAMPSAARPQGEGPAGTQSLEPNGQAPRAFHGSVLDSTRAVRDGDLQYDSGTAAYGPMYVDPLPMPLASMVIDNRRQSIDSPKDIVVPTYACLAGR